MSDTIKIPSKIESRNVIDRLHWSTKSNLRKTYQLFIRQQMSHYRLKKAEPGEKFILELTTFRKRRIADHDNLVGGAKQMIDALVHEGFIWDDDTKFIGKPSIAQAKAGKEECTIIRREKV